jgi:hypothetical protein
MEAASARQLEALFAEAGVCDSHGIDHARNVARLASKALQSHRGTPVPPLHAQVTQRARARE